MRISTLLIGALLSSATPAFAGWKVAESDHFILYSEAEEADVRANVEKLEKFDHIVRAFSQTKKPHAKLKLKVYQVRDLDAVAATLPYPTFGVGGYYTTSIRGPFLVATRRVERQPATRRTVVQNVYGWAPDVLQHEYIHHFTFQYFPATYPSWYTEGFAEYYGTIQFVDDKTIEFGHAPLGRVDTIKGDWLPMRKMLTAKNYDDVGDQLGSLYAQGWLLTHYASHNSVRGKQMNDYLLAITKGKDYKTAAEESFGSDLDLLDSELKAYVKNLKALRLSLKPINVGPITTRSLTDPEVTLLRADISLNSGLRRADLPQFTRMVADASDKMKSDENAQEIRLETEMIAGQTENAKSTIANLKAINPKNAMAVYFDAEMQVDELKKSGNTDAKKWDAVRELIYTANELRPNTPRILEGLFDSFKKQSTALPPEDAQNALMQAHLLLPSDSDLRYKLAHDFEARGLYPEAIFMISPLAFGSHEDNKNDKDKQRKEQEKFASKFTNFTVQESPHDMLKRLEAKLAKPEDKDAASDKVAVNTAS